MSLKHIKKKISLLTNINLSYGPILILCNNMVITLLWRRPVTLHSRIYLLGNILLLWRTFGDNVLAVWKFRQHAHTEKSAYLIQFATTVLYYPFYLVPPLPLCPQTTSSKPVNPVEVSCSSLLTKSPRQAELAFL